MFLIFARGGLLHGLFRGHDFFTGVPIRFHTNLLVRIVYGLRNAFHAVGNRGNDLSVFTITTGKLTRLFQYTNGVRRVIRSLGGGARAVDVLFRHSTLYFVHFNHDHARLSNYVSRHAHFVTISRPGLIFYYNRHFMFRVRFLSVSRTTTTDTYARYPHYLCASEHVYQNVNSYLGYFYRRRVADRRNDYFTGHLITKEATTTRVVVIRTKRIVIGRQVTIRRFCDDYGLLYHLRATTRRVTSTRGGGYASPFSTTRRTMTYHATRLKFFQRGATTNLFRHNRYLHRVVLVLLLVIR